MMSWVGLAFLFYVLLSSYTTAHFLECLTLNSQHRKVEVYTPNDSSYMQILTSAIRNSRFASPKTPKPLFIVTPSHESRVQAIVVCSRTHDLQIRVRSGGHDSEGLSYTSHVPFVPFVMIDLINLRAIDVDIEDNSAWVQAGATLGELYYRIAEKSSSHSFPAGLFSTIGVGGHFSVGGFGAMMRKYGLAADHIIDARIVNANGEILDRGTMGEDLFWAIRGGGASSFGVVLAFKIELVRIPPIVAISRVTIKKDAAEIIQRWQRIATYEVPRELSIQVDISTIGNSSSRILQVQLVMMFLGPCEELVHIIGDKFPELEMKYKDCTEMSWIKSVVSLGKLPKEATLDALLNRTMVSNVSGKVKSDYVTSPLSKREMQEIFNKFLEEKMFLVIFSPSGGRMDEIPENATPYPHRAGTMYAISYASTWDEEDGGPQASEEHTKWMREMYDYMSPYVSKFPRAAYLGLRDLDLGFNKINTTSTYLEARIWGEKYFKGNFDRLVKVKSEVDPYNFFRNEQSIPPTSSESMKGSPALSF